MSEVGMREMRSKRRGGQKPNGGREVDLSAGRFVALQQKNQQSALERWQLAAVVLLQHVG